MAGTIADKLQGILDSKADIALAIEEKGGTVPEKLADYGDAIRALPSGDLEPADVEFIDYDGTVLYSYSLSELANMSALPELPTRDGFVNQGWNYTLQELKAAAASGDTEMSDVESYLEMNDDNTLGDVMQELGLSDSDTIQAIAEAAPAVSGGKKMTVGCTYITSDDVTRIYVTIPDGDLTLSINFSQSETKSVLFDWGDGTTDLPEATTQRVRTHTYQSPGNYVVSFTNQKSYATLKLEGNIGGSGAVANNAKITGVALGKILSIGSSVFHGCRNLTTLSIPSGVELKSYCLDGMTGLQAFVVPSTTTAVPSYMFRFCSKLEKVSFPGTATSIGEYAFYDCPSIKYLRLVNISSVGQYAFYNCSGLRNVEARAVSSFPTYCFYNCGSLKTIGTTAAGIMSQAFYGCCSLESLGTGTITSLGGGNSNFAYCVSLNELGTLAILANSDNSNRPTINQYCFRECKSLDRLVIAPDDSSVSLLISANAFAQAGITVFDFSACTKVPSLANVTAFANTPNDKKIIVPDSLYDSWKAADNWKSTTNNIVGSIVRASDA